jgi:hypothetical protein
MFRFTIRDMLWLTVVVALGIGWGLDHRRSAERYSEAALSAGHYLSPATLVHQAGYKIALDDEGQMWLIDPSRRDIGPAIPEYP